MRGTVCFLIILLSGCQSMPFLERSTEEVSFSVMPLWEGYQHCLVSTDPMELVSWPVRTAIDPQALGVACTLRAAAVMAEAEELKEARALYRRVLARYSSREWAYYVDRAKAALASLQDPASAVVAFRPDRALSH